MLNMPLISDTTANSYRFSGKVFICFCALLFFGSPLKAQSQTPISWSAFKFLIGEWVGEGTGAPGEGTGGFTFSYDLQNTVLVRTNYANYPATKDRPAFTHNDLMIVYQEEGKPRAIYFDNEQHVINYAVTVSSDSNSIVFLSDPVPSTPRFRLTNAKAGTDKIRITFEIAQPGKPESFTRYIEAVARRKK
jgi:hypothetical protein